ncbi:MAG: hypothetical protein KBS96_06570 [Lachnospiraceae bacterium]|nr:hypothetical protein [Candidatus Colinaster scatohippi]
MEYLIAIILFPFVMFAGVMITAKKEQNDREKERQRQLELKNALNEVGAKLNDRTLVVSKRTAKFAEYLRIVPVTTFYNTKTPEKLNFGAVTVGGVTTGGTYVTGGHTITHTQKTKKCTFHFLDEEM